MSERTKVLVVDDEEHHAEATAEILTRAGWDVTTAVSGMQGIELISRGSYDVVVTDLVMKDADGMEVLRQAKKRIPDAVVIVMTAYGSIDSAVETIKRGADDYVEKPINIHRLRQVVEKATERQRLTREVHELHRQLDKRYGFEGIIGNTEQMQRVLDVLNQISGTNVTVLIQGETGTGKELVARAIHNNSPRKNHKFLAINFAAISEGVLESELFGHEKGAFTSALATRKGYFEFADKGSLFLDELGDMPLTAQAKLLRVIESGEVLRVGSSKELAVDVRLIAASNKDLDDLVRQGRFREDLLYRIKGVTIKLPPLRERQVDMPLLVDHFIKEFNFAHNKRISGVTAEARRVLHSHPWPGNVRELRNVIENAVVLSKDDVIDVDDLQVNLAPGARPAAGVTALCGISMEEAEKELIKNTLAMVNGNREEAAKILGIGERTLYRKIKKYGLK